jgi:quercetin dioxygenase-like cupin family protein
VDIIEHGLVFVPGGTEGWHSHPGVVAAAVKSGTLTIYDTNCSKTTVTAGNAL